jgi:tetratricopeptide (TPR) repeat protein
VGNLGLVQSALPAWMSIMWNRGWYKDALDALELLPIRLSEFSSNDPKVALIYAQTKKFLGEFYCLNGDFQSGLREFQNGIQRINESDQPREESEMYHLPGNYRGAGGHSQDSKVMYQLGLVLAEKIGDLSLVHKFISRLAAEAYLEADYQGAIPIAKHALEIARQLEDKSRIVQSLSDLGNLYYAIKEYPRAKELLKETLSYLPDIGNQILEYNILNKLGRVLTANKEYDYASQTFSHGLDLLNAANADLLAAEMLVSVAELLNDMKEKSIAATLVSLIVNHPLISMELKARVGHLHEVLNAEKIQPEDRNWGLDQMMRVAGDVKLILDQKKSFQ